MRYITSIKFNILAILGILFISTSAYFMEFYNQELPCPLCLLQRFGFLACAFGFLLNLKFGNKMQHYGLSLIGALFTAAVAMRQILLHIGPASEAYGSTFLHLHLYTWSFIIAVLLILFIALALILEPPQYGGGNEARPALMKHSVTAAFALVILFCLANAITAYLICGFSACPSDPTEYRGLVFSYLRL
jgi:disulfide bond formation protein DsbB